MKIMHFCKFLVTEEGNQSKIDNPKEKIKPVKVEPKGVNTKVTNIPLTISYKDAETNETKTETVQIPAVPAIQKNLKMGLSFDVTTDCARGCPGCYVDAGRKTGCNAKSKYNLCYYRGELADPSFNAKNAELKNKTNEHGGLRMFSGGDYIPSTLPNNTHYRDLKSSNPTAYNREVALQKARHDFANKQIKNMLDDAKSNGWKVKAITKEKEFIDNHIFHDALNTVNLSMNKHEFGFTHDEVKNIKKTLGKHSHKVTGRVMAFTPNDLHDILNEKDKSHVGIVTSGHNFPGNGIVISPKNANDRTGTHTVYILQNFKDDVKEFLNGEDKPIQTVMKSLNKYVNEYNKKVSDVRAKIEGHKPILVTEYTWLIDPTDPAGRKNQKNVEKSGDEDWLIFENGKWKLKKHSPEGNYTKFQEKEQQRIDAIKQRKLDKKAAKLKQKNDETEDEDIQESLDDVDEQGRKVHKIDYGYDIDLDLKTFDKINPISPDFTEDDVMELAHHLKDKMCCAGGNCYTCTTHCGAKGCEKEKEKEQRTENKRNKFINILNETSLIEYEVEVQITYTIGSDEFELKLLDVEDEDGNKVKDSSIFNKIYDKLYDSYDEKIEDIINDDYRDLIDNEDAPRGWKPSGKYSVTANFTVKI